MPWFYVEKSQIIGDNIRISGDDFNHIKNVLRMQVGESITICDGQGTDYYCRLETFTSSDVIAKIEEMNDTKSELPAKIYLFQGIPKKDKMEWIIQKAVELGVYQIIPVAMKRCVAKIEDGKKEQKKRERWQNIATSAAKQSGRGMIPSVREVMSWKEAIKFANTLEYNIISYEQAKGIHDAHTIVKEACKRKSIGVFIGPEGGFDDTEFAMAKEAGILPITLGKRILRTETAGLTVVSILMFELELQAETLVLE